MSGAPLVLYRQLLRSACDMSSYNFRHYAIRRVRDAFISNKHLTDANEISKALKDGQRQLEMLKRQSSISQMYKSEELVIEK